MGGIRVLTRYLVPPHVDVLEHFARLDYYNNLRNIHPFGLCSEPATGEEEEK
jgi:hypothetical protein